MSFTIISTDIDYILLSYTEIDSSRGANRRCSWRRCQQARSGGKARRRGLEPRKWEMRTMCTIQQASFSFFLFLNCILDRHPSAGTLALSPLFPLPSPLFPPLSAPLPLPLPPSLSPFPCLSPPPAFSLLFSLLPFSHIIGSRLLAALASSLSSLPLRSFRRLRRLRRLLRIS